jgi:hypothetical protein
MTDKKDKDTRIDIEPEDTMDIQAWKRSLRRKANKKGSKRGKPAGKCLICTKGPLVGFGFCRQCYGRLKRRLKKEFKEQGLDYRDHKKEVDARMEEFQEMAREGDYLTLLPHYKPNCMRCLRSISIARGLCQCCYQFYNQRVHMGKTTWEDLVAKGKAKDRKPHHGKKWGTKHKIDPNDEFQGLDDDE